MKILLLPLFFATGSVATEHNTFQPSLKLPTAPTKSSTPISTGAGSYIPTYDVSALAGIYDGIFNAASSAECDLSGTGSAVACEVKVMEGFKFVVGELSIAKMAEALDVPKPESGGRGSGTNPSAFYGTTSMCAVELDTYANFGSKLEHTTPSEGDSSLSSWANACSFMNQQWLPNDGDGSGGSMGGAWAIDQTLTAYVTEEIGQIAECATQECIGNSFHAATQAMFTVVRYYTQGLASLAAFTCSNQNDIDGLRPFTTTITNPTDMANYFLDAIVPLLLGKPSQKWAELTNVQGTTSLYEDTGENVALGGFVNNAASFWSIDNPTAFMIAKIEEMGSLIDHQKCSFGNPNLSNEVQGGADDKLYHPWDYPSLMGESDAGYLMTLADAIAQQVDIAFTRNILRGFEVSSGGAPPTADQVNQFLTDAGENLSIRTVQTASLLTKVSQMNFFMWDSVTAVDPMVKYTTPLMKTLIFFGVQDCEAQIGTLTGATPRDCEYFGYQKEWGTDEGNPAQQPKYGIVFMDGYTETSTGLQYQSLTNVRSMSNSLIDVYAAKQAVKIYDSYHASAIQFNGKYSQKAQTPKSGKAFMRTIQGMSITNTKCAFDNWICSANAKYFKNSMVNSQTYPESGPSTNNVDTWYTPTWYGGMISGAAYPPNPPMDEYINPDGVDTFRDATGAGRAEANSKLTPYLVVYQYILSEMADQISDCLNGKKGTGSYTAVDESVAFALGRYLEADMTQSLLIPPGQTDYPDLGQQVPTSWCDLQRKYQPRFLGLKDFCKDFLEQANLMKAMVAGLNDNVDNDFCGLRADPNGGTITTTSPVVPTTLDAMKDIVNRVGSLLSIPMVTGAMYYTNKLEDDLNEAAAAGEAWQEHLAEGNAFNMAILPQIAQCNPFAAEKLAMALQFTTDAAAARNNFNSAGGRAGILNLILDNIVCLGITCKDLGLDGDNTSVYATACKATLNTNLPVEEEADHYVIAEQYKLAETSDIENKQVKNRCKMNLDIKDMSDSIKTDGDTVRAKQIFTTGLNSPSGADTLRTLAGLANKVPSTPAITFNQNLSVLGQQWANKWATYIMDSDECSAAEIGTTLNGKRDACAAVVSDAMILDIALPYASWEFSDVSNDCASGQTNNNFGGVKALDEGVCFYSGTDQLWPKWGEIGYSGYSMTERGTRSFDHIIGSDTSLDFLHGLGAVTSSDAYFATGQSSVNSDFMKEALKAQKAVENNDCTKVPGIETNGVYTDAVAYKPKALNVAEHDLQGDLKLVQVKSLFYRLAQFVVAQEEGKPLNKYHAMLAQNAALPVYATMKYCDPYDGAKVLKNQVLGPDFLPTMETPISTIGEGTFLTFDKILGEGDVKKYHAFEQIVHSVAKNYQCFGFRTCQQLGDMLIPPTTKLVGTNPVNDLKERDAKAAAKAGVLLYNTLIAQCGSYVNPRSKLPGPNTDTTSTQKVTDAQNAYFNGVRLSGNFSAPKKMPFIDYTFTSNVFQHIMLPNDIQFINTFVSMPSKSDTELMTDDLGGFLTAKQVWEAGHNSYKDICSQPQMSLPEALFMSVSPKCDFTNRVTVGSGTWHDPDHTDTQVRVLARLSPGFRSDNSFDFTVSNNNVAFWKQEADLTEEDAKKWTNVMLEGVWDGSDQEYFKYSEMNWSIGARGETLKKVAAYAQLGIYGIREFRAVYTDLGCDSTDLPDYNAAIIHHDEGVSFMTGSNMYNANLQTNKDFGQSTYGLYFKRASYFSGVTTPGYYTLAAGFLWGANLINQQSADVCENYDNMIQIAENGWMVPLVQGVVQYTAKNAFTDGVGGQVWPVNPTIMTEEIGEVFGFAAAIIPQVWSSNNEAGNYLNDCLNPFTQSTDLYLAAGYWNACIGALESQYTAMGIDCDQIGNLIVDKVGGTEAQSWECGKFGDEWNRGNYCKDYGGKCVGPNIPGSASRALPTLVTTGLAIFVTLFL